MDTSSTSATALEMLLCCGVIAILLDLALPSRAARTAFVEIVVRDSTDQDSVISTNTLQGTFANIGTLNRAQGDVLQVGFVILA